MGAGEEGGSGNLKLGGKRKGRGGGEESGMVRVQRVSDSALEPDK